MKERGNRDEMVIATKFTSNYVGHKKGKGLGSVNASGNHKRSLHVSLRDSLKKLDTEWIDILYVHWWDWTTSIEELMDSLDAVVDTVLDLLPLQPAEGSTVTVPALPGDPAPAPSPTPTGSLLDLLTG